MFCWQTWLYCFSMKWVEKAMAGTWLGEAVSSAKQDTDGCKVFYNQCPLSPDKLTHFTKELARRYMNHLIHLHNANTVNWSLLWSNPGPTTTVTYDGKYFIIEPGSARILWKKFAFDILSLLEISTIKKELFAVTVC